MKQLREMLGCLYVENVLLKSLTGGKGVSRCHLSRQTWEVVIEAVQELGGPLKPLVKELGVSRSSCYRKRKGYLAGGIANRKKRSGRPKTCTIEIYGRRIVELLRQLPPTAEHRRVWVKLREDGSKRNTVWRLMKEMEFLLPKQKGKGKRRYKKPSGLPGVMKSGQPIPPTGL